MQKVVTVVRSALDRALGAIGSGPDEDVHDMFATLVNQRRDRAAVEVVQAAADEAEAVGGKVVDRGREIDPPVEPRFDRMLVGRDHVHQMTRHQRAQMAGQDLAGDDVGLGAVAQRHAVAERRAATKGPPQPRTAVEHHQREHRERGPGHRPSRISAGYSAALAAAGEPSEPPPGRARRGCARRDGGLASQRRADAAAQRIRRCVAQSRVAERRAQRRERRALARAIGALLEMALDFERRLESQFAVSVGVD